MAINNYKHNLEEPLVVKDLQITGTRVDNQNTLVFTKSIQLSADNTSGGGLILSDDGDIVDLNTGYGAFRFSNGIQVYSASRGGSSVIQLGNTGDITLQSSTSNINFANNSGTTTRGVIGLCGDNDFWFFGGGATASNAGFAQISTGDDGTEPIYVRQYVGDPRAGTLQRTLTLLNESGNTSIPGSMGVSITNPGANLDVFGTSRFGGTVTAGRRADIDTTGRLTLAYGDNSNQPNLTLQNTSDTNTTTNHGSHILWQFGTDTTNTPINAGRINILKQQQWTTTSSTQNAYFSIDLTSNGGIGERVRVTSAGFVGIATTNPTSTLTNFGSFATGLTANTLSVTNDGDGIVRIGPGIINTPTGTGRLNIQDRSGTYLSLYYGTGLVGRLNAPTVSDIALEVGGTERLRILGTGNIGIGTTNPQSQLHITGQFQSTQANSTATGGGQIYLNGANGNRIDFNQNGIGAPTFSTRSAGTKLVLYPSVGGSGVDYAVGMDSSTLWFSIETNSNRQFRWYAGTTNIATLFGTGQLVLGTTTLTGTASQPLQVTGGAYFNGDVGIGTTNPANGITHLDIVRPGANIQVRNTSTTGQASVFASDVDYFTSFRSVYISKLGTAFAGNVFGSIPNADLGFLAFQNTTNALIYTNGGTPIIFGTTSAEAMRIDASQRVGIGTNSPTSKLHVVGDSLVTGIATVGLGATSTPPSNSQMSFELTSNTNLRIKVRGTDGVLRSANITLT